MIIGKELSRAEWIRHLDDCALIPHINRVIAIGLVKAAVDTRPIFRVEERIARLRGLIQIVSDIKPGENGFFQSVLSFAAYKDVAEEARFFQLDVGQPVRVEGSLRQILAPGRWFNEQKASALAAVLGRERDDSIVPSILSLMNMAPARSRPVEEMAAITALDRISRPTTSPCCNEHIILAEKVVDGFYEPVCNQIDLQGIIHRPPECSTAFDGRQRVTFKIMVRRPDSTLYDIIPCIWFPGDKSISTALRQGFPVRINGSLEHERYRIRSIAASNEETKKLSRYLALAGCKVDVATVIDTLGLSLDPRVTTKTVHQVWIRELYLDKSDFYEN